METENNTNQNTTPPANQPAPAPVDNTTLMGILAYLGPLVLIPYLTAKNDPFVKFHIKQGLVLVAIEIVLMILSSMIWGIPGLFQLLNLGLIILSILGIVNVTQKKETELPLVGQFSKYFNNI